MKRLLLLLSLLLSCFVAKAQPREVSVQEFLKLSRTDTASYVVRGVVEKVRSSTSGSFYLKDATGTMLVYGIADPANPGLSFSALDIVKGDTLSVMGRFTIYNGTTKEMKDGRLLSKSDGPDHHLSFYDRLDRKPIFKGKEGQEGLKAFREWVQAHVRKPTDGAAGTVKVRFVVGRNGGVQEVQIVEGLSPALNEEARRVVMSSPKWKPAKADGAEVRITYTIPVRFE